MLVIAEKNHSYNLRQLLKEHQCKLSVRKNQTALHWKQRSITTLMRQKWHIRFQTLPHKIPIWLKIKRKGIDLYWIKTIMSKIRRQESYHFRSTPQTTWFGQAHYATHICTIKEKGLWSVDKTNTTFHQIHLCKIIPRTVLHIATLLQTPHPQSVSHLNA